jgi:hypothetical protein
MMAIVQKLCCTTNFLINATSSWYLDQTLWRSFGTRRLSYGCITILSPFILACASTLPCHRLAPGKHHAQVGVGRKWLQCHQWLLVGHGTPGRQAREHVLQALNASLGILCDLWRPQAALAVSVAPLLPVVVPVSAGAPETTSMPYPPAMWHELGAYPLQTKTTPSKWQDTWLPSNPHAPSKVRK